MKKSVIRALLAGSSVVLLSGALLAAPKGSKQQKEDRGLEQAESKVKNPNARKHIEANEKRQAAHKSGAMTHRPGARGVSQSTAAHRRAEARQDEKVERKRDRREDKAELKRTRRDEREDKRGDDDRRYAKNKKRGEHRRFGIFHRNKDKKDKDNDRN